MSNNHEISSLSLSCNHITLSCRCGGFRLRPGLWVALHLAVILILVWGVLSWLLPGTHPLAIAQVNPDDWLSSENPGKRTWNSKTWDLYEGNGRFKTEFHSKWINYLDSDGWKPINPTLREYPISDPDYYTADQLPFKVKIPKSSLGVASFESNNRYDIFEEKKIDEPPITQTMSALDVQNVSGVLENYEQNGGLNNSVRYPLAYPQYNADLIYWIHHGKAPRLNKLIKFTTNPYVKEDVRLSFKLTFDAPMDIEAEEVENVIPSPVEGSSSSTAGDPSASPQDDKKTARDAKKDPDVILSEAKNPRQKWSQQAKLKTKKKVSIRAEGAATSTRRGIGMKDFHVWDSSTGSTSSPANKCAKINKD